MYKQGLWKRCFCCIAAAAAAAGVFSASFDGTGLRSSAAPESEEYEQRLAQLDKEQDALDKKINDAEKHSDKQQDKLDAVTAKLSSLRAEQSELEELNSRIISEMVEVDADLREISHELEQQENAIRQEVNAYSGRLRALYLAGAGSYADIIFTSDDFFDVLMRTELVKRVAEHDKNTIDGLLEKLRSIKSRKEEAAERSAQLKERTQEYSDRRQQLEKSIADQNALEEKYRDELEKAGILTEQLAEESRRLEEERAEVSRKASEAVTTTTATAASAAGTTAAASTKKTAADDTGTTAVSSAETEAPVTAASSAETQTTSKTTTATAKTTSASTTGTTAATTAVTTPVPDSDRAAKIKKVLDYALSNVGGTYVWGGASYRACDCSGLTMLAYHQIGIEIPHWTVTQCQQGWAVSYSDLQPGDLVFFGGSSYNSVYHAAMYIGNGQIVHAENSQTGIVISDLARFSIWNPIAYLRRLI